MIKDELAGQVNRTFQKNNLELEKLELVQSTAYLRHVFHQKSRLHKW